jgi:hypothetical protein
VSDRPHTTGCAIFFFALGLVLLFATVLRGYVPAQSHEAPSIERALLETLVVWRRPDGRPIFVGHCRRAREGCEPRIARIAQLVESTAQRHALDPWLLAALVVRESGANPDARGALGELGLTQLHPRSPWGRRAIAECERQSRECDAIVLDESAALLVRALGRCGTELRALGLYHSGRCSVDSYAHDVLRRRDALRARGAS